jgi:transcriptional regulator with PAS, ATPase and Fis domain
MRKCTLQKRDGSYIHCLKNASLLYDADSKVLGAVESVTDITEIIEKDNQIEAYRRELRSEDSFHGLLGSSSHMQQVFNLITNAAKSDAPVIIFGESGTGKELVSRAIHSNSTRKHKPFVKVSCAALTESLLESELFGHVKGAYTGAYRNREGRFETAHGGYIFLDEIGDMPLSVQVKLLRVLEEKIIERVGDNTPIPIDARIITATNKDLKDMASKGAFRKDLYFRINVIPIHMLPLRDRKEDIPLLAESFFRKSRLKSGKSITGISNEAMELLMNYSWPGNVRELKSAFEYAFVTCQESMILPDHLPPTITQVHSLQKAVATVAKNREELKRNELTAALKQARGNQSEAARILGISRVTVWNRMKKFGIDFKREIKT